MPASNEQLIPEPGTAAVRCYNVGLGDCFLLAFSRPEDEARPYYVAIDCGIARGTPDEEERISTAVADIRDATNGEIDLLILTHEHYDHVIGFVHAAEIWQEMTVHQVFVPWTEIEGDPDVEVVTIAARRLNAAADRAAERLAELDDAGFQRLSILNGGLLAAGNEVFGISAAEAIALGWQTAQSLGPEGGPVYCEPGDVFSLNSTGVNAYILGPPRPQNRAGKPVVSARGTPLLRVLEAKAEMYSYENLDGAPDVDPDLGLLLADPEADEAIASSLLGFGPEGDDRFLDYCPFDPSMRIDWESAMDAGYFEDHYGAGEAWRRVDFDWLGQAADIALRAGGYTNNLSLVVAFELPGTKKVLLFVGDAQVGNWLSWREIGNWWPVGEDGPGDAVDIDDLLARVAFYKVGHHGSHNATTRGSGLEKMGQGDLTAYVPVSVGVAHDIMTYCPMPYYPLMAALQRRTGGAVYLGNGDLLEPLPAGADRDELTRNVRHSDAQLGPKIRIRDDETEELLEGPVPLWTEFTIIDEA